MQKINNKWVQSEQLNNNGRIPESNKSIRSLYNTMRAGLIVLPTLMLLTGCAMKDYNLNPFTTVMNQLVTKPIITAKKNKGD